MTSSLEDLRRQYEENGRAFADTTWVTIEKLIARKQLAFLTGFSAIPAASDEENFEKFVLLQVRQAEASCRRDLDKKNIADSTVLLAFMQAFSSRFREHLRLAQ